MPSASLRLLVYPTEKKALSSLYSEQEFIFPEIVHGEEIRVSVTEVERIANPTNGRLWEPVAVDSTQIKVAVGKSYQLPQAGDFPLTWEGDETAAITYQPTAQQVQDALNALASITSAGGVTVREPDDAAGNFFLVEWNQPGARTLISGDPDNLAPFSTIDVGTLITGSVNRTAVQTIRIVQQPGAFVILDDTLPAAAATMTNVQAGGGGFNQKWRVVLDPPPYDGKFTLTVDTAAAALQETDLIAIDVDSDTMTAALEALSSVGIGNVSVVAEANYSWLISFTGTLANQAIAMTAIVTALKVLPGQVGDLDTATPGIELALAGAESTSGLLEIKATPPGQGAKVWVQEDITIVDALIDPSSTSSTPAEDELRIFTTDTVSAAGEEILTAGKVVRTYQLITQAGAGAYTYTITLQTGAATNGDVVNLLLELPQSANPTIEVRNATSAGTLLHTISGNTDAAQYQSVTLVFNGTAWQKIGAHFI